MIEAPALPSQVATTLTALRTALDALPLDDDLPTPKAVEANFARRSLLNQTISRLRMDLQHLQELEPKAESLQQWLTVLQECHRDFAQKLLDAEDISDLRQRERTVDALRHSLHDISDGPERVGAHEFMRDILVHWFNDHQIVPLPNSGFFEGRGGLRSAEHRLATLMTEVSQARADVEYSLRSAKELS